MIELSKEECKYLKSLIELDIAHTKSSYGDMTGEAYKKYKDKVNLLIKKLSN